MTLETGPVNGEKIWIKFLRKHWKMFALFIVMAILAIIGAILVFLWVVAETQLTGLVPTTLNLWAIGHIVTLILHVIFWEAIYIAIPVIIAVVAIWQLWWKRLPDDERREYKQKHLFGKRSRKSDGGGAITFFVNIVFVIKVYLDGNWNEPFANWTFDYLIYSYLWAIIWILAIVGIPIAIGATWWIHHEMKKES